MPSSRTGTWSRSSSMPSPPLPAISTEEEVSPAAPMSWIATIASPSINSRQASISNFSVNGSPTCTVGRISPPSAPNSAEPIVAQYATHPGRRALIRFDKRGVVVALDLEDDRLAIADIDDPGILARPADHDRAGGRQGPQPHLGRFVGAVLAPHRREDAELGLV